MRLTDEELVSIWRYFQLCCLPAIIMAKYAYMDYIDDIRKEKAFYRHETKQAINRIGRRLEVLPNELMNISREHRRYMNILGDNIEELFQRDEEELHRGIFISFRNAGMNPPECLSALHFISAMLQIASATFSLCCDDLQRVWHKDVREVFGIYDLKGLVQGWDRVLEKADSLYSKDRSNRKAEEVDLNNPRCTKAVHEIRKRLSDIETLRTAMRKSYPWSPNFKEGIPFEESDDYLIVNSNNQGHDGIY